MSSYMNNLFNVFQKGLNRELIMCNKVLWLTGLSGSGKTTIANGLSSELVKLNKKVKILDGDNIRNSIHTELGFTPGDIEINNKKIARMCKEMIKDFEIIIVPIISPFSSLRKVAREIIGPHFFEIYVMASINTVQLRDVKGLYKKVAEGKIENFIGIDPLVPYEVPENPDFILNTEEESKSESVMRLLEFCNH